MILKRTIFIQNVLFVQKSATWKITLNSSLTILKLSRQIDMGSSRGFLKFTAAFTENKTLGFFFEVEDVPKPSLRTHPPFSQYSFERLLQFQFFTSFNLIKDKVQQKKTTFFFVRLYVFYRVQIWCAILMPHKGIRAP